MAFSIAIDGPAGAGKSTIAKALAKRLGFIYVDTGAMYRTMALELLRKGISPEDVPAMEQACQDVEISIAYEEGSQQVYLNGENVSSLIRREEVGNMASVSAANGKIREKLVDLQRQTAQKISMIVDGRDICTYVFPDAPYKFYITADVSERAKRRAAQLAEKGIVSDIEQLEKEIAARDHNDMNRKMAPLRIADDAVLIDTTHMTQKEVVDKVLSYIKL